MSDQDIDRIVEYIDYQLQDGKSLEVACQNAEQIANDRGKVKKAKKLWKEKRIKPAGIVSSDHESSYAGLGEDAVYWPSLKQYMIEKKEGFDQDVVNSIDEQTERIMAALKNPGCQSFNQRGLVLGYVQSGKTANYTSLIAKAADWGYKLFVVLSGMYNSLRRQTRSRLIRELRDQNEEDWAPLTESDEDFRRTENATVYLTEKHDMKVLCVTKKNTYVLQRLKNWLSTAKDSVLQSCPTLLIDDEADQASIDVSRDRNDRSAINGHILDILETLPKVSYIGYTATPFANILVNPFDKNDLYPRDFIISLPKPEEYYGAEQIFGRERLDNEEGEEEIDGYDMVRSVPEHEADELSLDSSEEEDFTPEITPTFEKAIKYFWLATGARLVRGQKDSHSSMLVHVSRLIEAHEELFDLIIDFKTGVYEQVLQGDESVKRELRNLWNREKDRVPCETENYSNQPVRFEEIWPHLEEVIEHCKIIVENSNSEDRLDYEEEPQTVIAVGGDALSRGLTLEGLVVSYYLRYSLSYDTLIQMGRWFGYRQGYEDLPRIWMPDTLRGFFFDMATVEKEIRDEISVYEKENLTPREYRVRIRRHPELNVTAPSKREDAILARTSFAGRDIPTTYFKHKDGEWLENNISAARNLIKTAKESGIEEKDSSIANAKILEGIPVQSIFDFLEDYSIHERNMRNRGFSKKALREYIARQNDEDRLLEEWNVAIVTRSPGEEIRKIDLGLDEDVSVITRSKMANTGIEDAYIKGLTSTKDVVIDLDIEGYSSSTRRELIQNYRPDSIGLIVLYPIDKNSEPTNPENSNREPLNAEKDVIGMDIVFPDSGTYPEKEYIQAPEPE